MSQIESESESSGQKTDQHSVENNMVRFILCSKCKRAVNRSQLESHVSFVHLGRENSCLPLFDCGAPKCGYEAISVSDIAAHCIDSAHDFQLMTMGIPEDAFAEFVKMQQDLYRQHGQKMSTDELHPQRSPVTTTTTSSSDQSSELENSPVTSSIDFHPPAPPQPAQKSAKVKRPSKRRRSSNRSNPTAEVEIGINQTPMLSSEQENDQRNKNNNSRLLMPNAAQINGQPAAMTNNFLGPVVSQPFPSNQGYGSVNPHQQYHPIPSTFINQQQTTPNATATPQGIPGIVQGQPGAPVGQFQQSFQGSFQQPTENRFQNQWVEGGRSQFGGTIAPFQSPEFVSHGGGLVPSAPPFGDQNIANFFNSGDQQHMFQYNNNNNGMEMGQRQDQIQLQPPFHHGFNQTTTNQPVFGNPSTPIYAAGAQEAVNNSRAAGQGQHSIQQVAQQPIASSNLMSPHQPFYPPAAPPHSYQQQQQQSNTSPQQIFLAPTPQLPTFAVPHPLPQLQQNPIGKYNPTSSNATIGNSSAASSPSPSPSPSADCSSSTTTNLNNPPVSPRISHAQLLTHGRFQIGPNGLKKVPDDNTLEKHLTPIHQYLPQSVRLPPSPSTAAVATADPFFPPPETPQTVRQERSDAFQEAQQQLLFDGSETSKNPSRRSSAPAAGNDGRSKSNNLSTTAAVNQNDSVRTSPTMGAVHFQYHGAQNPSSNQQTTEPRTTPSASNVTAANSGMLANVGSRPGGAGTGADLQEEEDQLQQLENFIENERRKDELILNELRSKRDKEALSSSPRSQTVTSSSSTYEENLGPSGSSRKDEFFDCLQQHPATSRPTSVDSMLNFDIPSVPSTPASVSDARHEDLQTPHATTTVPPSVSSSEHLHHDGNSESSRTEPGTSPSLLSENNSSSSRFHHNIKHVYFASKPVTCPRCLKQLVSSFAFRRHLDSDCGKK